MYVLDALKELEKDSIQDEELLRLVVIELNLYLVIEDRLPLSNLPPLKIVLSLIDSLSDTDKYTLYAQEIKLSDPSSSISYIETTTPVSHDFQDQIVKIMVGLFAGLICIIAVVVDTDSKVDWAGLLHTIIEYTFKNVL